VDLTLTGQQLLVMRNRQVRLRANADLRLAGSLTGGGALTGAVALTDGRIYQRLEITPLLQSATAESGRAPLLLPDLRGLVPPPLDAWKLDLTVANADPFLIVGNVASGSIEPDLRIIGTLGDPRPTGTVTLRDLRAFLPFSIVHIPEGLIHFLEESPRSPTLDIRGYSEVLQYEIMLLAQGSLEEQNIILRSDPPLSEDQILLLLTTGLTPGTGAGMGEAAAGQGSLLLLKTLAREFEPEGVDLDDILNRIQVGTYPPPFMGMRPTLLGEFRLTDNISLFSRRDGFGYFSGGATHTWRFR
jgi:autotransporter translocation and assembly factor TamB